MDEFREKTGAENLPRHKLPCWNEEMTPAKAELSTGTTPSRQPDARRSSSSDSESREVGLALTDALADILRAEREPRGRRSVS